jgi:hypothetical protein
MVVIVSTTAGIVIAGWMAPRTERGLTRG